MIAVFVLTLSDLVGCFLYMLLACLIVTFLIVQSLNTLRWDKKRRDEINEENAHHDAKAEAATPEPPKVYGTCERDGVIYDLIPGSCSKCVGGDSPEVCNDLPNCLVDAEDDTAWVRRES